MPAQRPNRRWGKPVLSVGAGLLLIVGMLVWIGGTQTMLRLLAGQAMARSSGQLSLTGVSGSLYGPLRIQALRYQDPAIRIAADNIELDWKPWQLLTQGRVELGLLKIGVIGIRIGELSTDPLPLPDTLRLPVQLTIPGAEIARITLGEGDQRQEITGLRLSLVPTADHHRLALSGYSPQWGKADVDISLAQDRPFALSAEGKLAGGGTKNIGMRLDAHGFLDRITLNIDGTIESAKLTGKMLALPLETNVIRALDMQASDIDPARWDDAWPAAKIGLDLDAQSDPAGTWSGSLRLANGMPGTIDRQRLPLTELTARLDGSLEKIQLSGLLLRLHGGGQLSGNVQIAADDIHADLAAMGLNLHGMHGKLAKTALKGKLNLGWDGRNGALLADMAQNGYRIHLDARQTDEQMTLKNALVQAGKGELLLTGDMSLSGPGNFRLEGALKRFDPASFGAFPDAMINAGMQASGNLFGQRSISGAFNIADSRLAGQPLSGSGKLALRGERLANVNISLKLAENRLSAAGNLGATGDRLTVKLDAPRLDHLGAGFAGKAHAKGVVEGTYHDPSGELEATFSGFRWLDYRVAEAQLSARLSRGIDGPVNVTASLSDFQGNGLSLSQGSIDLTGTRGNHHATLKAKGRQVDLNGALTGGWRAAQGWTGRLEKLENTGAYLVELLEPALLTVGPERVSLQGARLRLLKGSLMVDEASYQKGDLTTRGSFSGVPASDMQRLSGSALPMDLSLILAGNWDLHIGQDLDGTVDVRRESGDIVVLSEPNTPLGLSALALQLAARHNRVSLQMDVQGTRLGSLSVQGETTLSRRNDVWGIDGSAPVRGKAEVAVKSLAWLAPLVSPALETDGALNMQFSAKGTVNKHELEGTFAGSDLRLEWPDQGVYLKDGLLRGDLAGDRLQIRELSLSSGAGRLTASGVAFMQQSVPHVTLALVADKAELISRPDRTLTISGTTTASAEAAQLRIQGKLQVDRGMIELPKADLPALSDDVVVLGRKEDAKRKAVRMRPDVDMELDLGKQFFLKGRGLDAQLAGAVRLRSDGAGLPLANGSIRVEKGDYFAYGQRLVIDRGILNFSGPIDNPGLNIVAMRKKQAVEAGVSITGTALAPQVSLVSNPSVPDSEKISWLVLGHGLEGSSKSELGLMGAAASTLLAAGESVTLQSQIAQAAGLDEFGLSGTGTLASTAVTMGKRLSSRAYLSYEQSVMGASNLVKINYMLTDQWSVRSQSGTDNAVDLFYTLSFD